VAVSSVATVLVHFLGATRPDALVFVWTSVFIIAGALGVVLARNPVHSALMLVMTLFSVAVIFIELQANFLAAIQVIVYAGAIVVMFLFVIMLLGVDKVENLETDPLRGQRPIAIVLVVLALGGVLALGIGAHWAVGAHAVAGARNQTGGDVAALGRSVFTTYLFPFEVTAALLVIAVVGAVVLSRQTPGTRSSNNPADQSPAGPDPAVPDAEAVDLDPADTDAGETGTDKTDPENTAPADTDPVKSDPVKTVSEKTVSEKTVSENEEARL
jgi:NADH-quinone oxidoreductase subunit J